MFASPLYFTHYNQECDHLGGLLVSITLFWMLWVTTIQFFSSLFPTMANDTHILGLSFEVTSTFEFLAYQLQAICFSMQPHKCITWSPFNFLVDFKTPFSFNIILVAVKFHFKTPFSFNIALVGVEVYFKTPFSFNIPLANVKVLGILIFKPSRLHVKKMCTNIPSFNIILKETFEVDWTCFLSCLGLGVGSWLMTW